MRIVADENILFAREAFGRFGDVRLVSGRDIDRRSLAGVDALIVRSITRVDRELLFGTSVRFVGTATIGTDHLDLEWLAREGVQVADAAGANSRSVGEYVITAILEMAARMSVEVPDATLGIIGVGRIGTIVSELARAIGMHVIEFDPPRAERERTFFSSSFDDVLRCDVLTLHVPLTSGGPHPTVHLIGRRELDSTETIRILLNTSRGGVVETASLVEGLRRGRPTAAVLDVWEGEPDVPAELISRTAIATPHVAGYSYDGKLNGTWMMARALAKFAGATNEWNPNAMLNEPAGVVSLKPDVDPITAARAATMKARDLLFDDRSLRNLLESNDVARRAGFDRLRREYPRRREFRAWTVVGATREAAETLEALGFRTQTGI